MLANITVAFDGDKTYTSKGIVERVARKIREAGLEEMAERFRGEALKCEYTEDLLKIVRGHVKVEAPDRLSVDGLLSRRYVSEADIEKALNVLLTVHADDETKKEILYDVQSRQFIVYQNGSFLSQGPDQKNMMETYNAL